MTIVVSQINAIALRARPGSVRWATLFNNLAMLPTQWRVDPSLMSLRRKVENATAGIDLLPSPVFIPGGLRSACYEGAAAKR